MRSFTAEGFGPVHVLSLDQGELVLESIIEFVDSRGITDAVVLTGIGTLDACTLHMVTTTGYPPVEHFERWEGKPLELVSIEGVIANGVPHLHAVVSDNDMAYAGHLEEGCRVLYLCEIVIAELKGVKLERIRSDKNILKLVEKK